MPVKHEHKPYKRDEFANKFLNCLKIREDWREVDQGYIRYFLHYGQNDDG